MRRIWSRGGKLEIVGESLRTSRARASDLEAMGFWRGEHCEHCGGALVDRKVTLHRKVKARHVIVENVPAGVCSRCGTRFYAAGVLKSVEAAIHGRLRAGREIRVPVYSL